MSAFVHSRGRFFDDRAESGNINRAIREFQEAWGTTVDWWVFLPAGPISNSPYTDEFIDNYRDFYSIPDPYPSNYWDYYTIPDPSSSDFDDLYDEGEDDLPGGKRYRPVYRMPVLSAVVEQGDESADDLGQSSYDRMTLRLSYDQLRRSGVTTDPLASRDRMVLDRFVYREKVFDVTSVVTAGHMARQDDFAIIVRGIELRADELQDTPQFSRYTPQG